MISPCGWQSTIGPVPGAYARLDRHQLYVRPPLDPDAPAAWLWFVDGVRGGAASSEATARRKAEAAAFRNSVLRASAA